MTWVCTAGLLCCYVAPYITFSRADVLARNASLVVGLAGKEGSIPVVKGQSKPLMRAYGGHSGMTIHGEQDCLGNLPCPFTIPSEPTDHDHTSAARFLVDTCAANPGEVTLVTLGPLTNIAVRCWFQSGRRWPQT